MLVLRGVRGYYGLRERPTFAGYYGLRPVGVGGGIFDWIRRQLPEEVRNIKPGRVLEEEVRRRLRESEIRRIIEQARQGGASDAELQRLLGSLQGAARTNWPMLAAAGIAGALLLRGRRRR